MARDKQIVVRVTDELRADFQRFCEREGVTASKVLADIVWRLCRGELPLAVALEQSEYLMPVQQQSEYPMPVQGKIAALVEKEVERAAATLLASLDLSEKIEAAIAERFTTLKKAAQLALDIPTSPLADEGVPPSTKSELEGGLSETPTVKPKPRQKPTWRIDLSNYDPDVGFTGMELAQAIGFQSSSPVVDAVREGRFADWSKKKDPDGRTWDCTGKGKQRRFFRREGN